MATTRRTTKKATPRKKATSSKTRTNGPSNAVVLTLKQAQTIQSLLSRNNAVSKTLNNKIDSVLTGAL